MLLFKKQNMFEEDNSLSMDKNSTKDYTQFVFEKLH